MTPEEKRAYARGYAAGKARVRKVRQVEHEWQRERARLDRFMAAAMTGLLAAPTRWKRGEVADTTPEQFADTAFVIARAMAARHP